MTQMPLAKARQLCTPQELQVVRASRRPALQKLGAKDLAKQITEARRLRDKWRDVSTRQRRQTQSRQGSRVTDEHARSQQKAELFADSLARLEAQRESLAAAGASDGKPASGKPSKQQRAEQHRQTRADTRDQLEQTRAALTSQPGAASDGRKKAAAKSTTAAGKKKAAKKSTKKPPAKTTASVKKKPPKASQEASARQLSAQADAKAARVKASGLTSRTRGHVSAQGKRAQSRRDKKG